MEIYNYNSSTFEYTGASLADECQIVPGDYLIPAYATIKAPPVVGENEICVFDEHNQEWIVAADYRGQHVPNPYVEGDYTVITKIDVRPEDIGFEEPDEQTVEEQRIHAYPLIGDQLDAIMKWITSGNISVIPQELKDIAEACMQVKEQFPKE